MDKKKFLKQLIIAFFICTCFVWFAEAISKNIDPNARTLPIVTNKLSLFEEKQNPAILFLSSTSDSKTPVIRYTNESLSTSIQSYIDYIDYQKTTKENGQVYIYFTIPFRDATLNLSYALADDIMSKKEWIGDRSRDSVAAEIYIHWIAENAKPLFMSTKKTIDLYKNNVIGVNDQRPSPIRPTHLGYFYSSLKEADPLEVFLKNI